MSCFGKSDVMDCQDVNTINVHHGPVPSDAPLVLANGCPLVHKMDPRTSGIRGSISYLDVNLNEQLAQLNRELTPERRMHALGSGYFGKFTVTNAAEDLCLAELFSKGGNECRVFVRFSTAAGERGFTTMDRGIMGTAIRFYTSEGNLDVVGNNTPVFYFSRPNLFPSLNHVVHRDPITNLRSFASRFDFFSHLPESLHQVTIDYSDRGMPKGFRHMHMFGSHTFSWWNKKNERFWIKYHFLTNQGIQNLTDAEGVLLTGHSNEFFTRDMVEHIAKGEFPKWTLYVQYMKEEEAYTHPYFKDNKINPFDLTQVWSHKHFPLRPVGVLELNELPTSFFRDVEQAGFSPSNVIPGIGFSFDKMLQARVLSYPDALRYRLGVNFHQIGVNQPQGMMKCPFMLQGVNGAIRVDGNCQSTIQYFPNSANVFSTDVAARRKEPPMLNQSTFTNNPNDTLERVYEREEDVACPHVQVRDLFELLPQGEKERLTKRLAGDLSTTSDESQKRFLDIVQKIHPLYHEMLSKALDEVKAMKPQKTVIDIIHNTLTNREALVDGNSAAAKAAFAKAKILTFDDAIQEMKAEDAKQDPWKGNLSRGTERDDIAVQNANSNNKRRPSTGLDFFR